MTPQRRINLWGSTWEEALEVDKLGTESPLRARGAEFRGFDKLLGDSMVLSGATSAGSLLFFRSWQI